MNIKIINPLNYQGWDDLLLSWKDYNFFHTSAWARVLFETYKYTPLYVKLQKDNEILGLIPLMEVKSFITGRRGVSLPFTDFCEPLLSENVNFRDIITRLIEFGKRSGWKHIEMRGGQFPHENIDPYISFYHHTLDITQSRDQILSSLRNSTKRNINKSEKEGVVVKFSNSWKSLNEFYRLNCKTRKNHGLPPQPKIFFKKIFEHIISKKLGFVTLASYNDIIISGGVFFHFGEKALFKYGASDNKYNYLRANNLLMWEVIKWYNEKSFKIFSFGRTHKKNTGLLQYKDGWGTEKSIVNYYKYDLTKDSFVTNHSNFPVWYNNIFKKTPVPLLRIIGSILYRHTG